MALELAIRAALALSIRAGDVVWTTGSVVSDFTRDAKFVLLGEDGRELQADAPPVFRLSTDGEAEDGNILDQEWDLSRVEAGIAPILGNHRLGQGMEFGLGNWRNARVATMPGEGGRPPRRELHADADFDMGDPVGAAVAGKVRRGYLRSVSVGWRPGFRTLRGDLPKDHRWYRAPQTDDCGTRIEGYVMGRVGDPNRLIEASMTPIPSDPGATEVDAGRMASAVRDFAAVVRGEAPAPGRVDLARLLLAIRDQPGVRAWAATVARAELLELARTDTTFRAELRALLEQPSAPPAPTTRTIGELLRRGA